MKFVEMELRIDQFPIKKGTPISAYGVESNNSDAIGIIPDTINEKPIGKARVLVAGEVDYNEYASAYGTYEDSALMAMDGIVFLKDGTRYPNIYKADYVLPAATAGKIGGVKQSANVPDAAGEAPTAAEFKALLDALKAAGIMAPDATE